MGVTVRGKRGVRVVILVEDQLLERFARKTIEGLGHKVLRVVLGCPSTGRDSVKQWVASKYTVEVKTFREKCYQQGIALLVGTDADEQTVDKRSGKLATALQDAELERRGDNEKIVHWIPRWSIETWGLALTGQSADEETRYKTTSQAKDIDWKAAASAFVEDYRRPPARRVTSLPSLVAAYDETNRLT